MATLRESIHQLLQAATTQFTPDPPRPIAQAPPSAQEGALTPCAAAELFQDLAAQRYLVWDWIADGACARAHELCRLIRERGYAADKAWNYAHNYDTPGGAALHVKTAAGEAAWRFHVAACVLTVDGDGAMETLALDPVLCERPVTLVEWKRRQGDAMSRLEQAEEQVYFRGPGGAVVVTDDAYAETQRTLSHLALECERRSLHS